MPRDPEKEYDRKARLIFVLHLLNCNTHGLTLKAVASHCGVSIRTTRRDLKALDAEFGAKFGKEDGRWVLMPGAVLPPVLFSLPEAMAVFMAVRLLLAQSSVYNRDIETTFTKLGAVVPPILRSEIARTLDWMRRHRPDGTMVKMLNIISRCWIERRRVKIRYWTLNALTAEERVIEPYFVQPSAIEHAVYVFAFCHVRREIRTFRLDRIIEAQALTDTYEIPPGFDANEYLTSFWSVTTTGEPRVVKLRFRKEVARIAAETFWHPSQVTEMQTDGSAVVTMKLALTRDLVSFVLGWSDMVEVLQPEALRRKVVGAARHLLEMYEEAQTFTLPAPLGAAQPAPPEVAEPGAVEAHEPLRAPSFTASQLPLFDDSTGSR